MKIKQIQFSTIVSYFVLGVLILLLLNASLFQEYLLWIVIVSTLFIIREMLFIFKIPKNIHYTVFDWKKFWNDVSKRRLWLSKIDCIIMLIREIVFPFFLVISMVLLLLRQLDIYNIADFLNHFFWIEYIFFGGLGFSAFTIIFRESVALDYFYEKIYSLYMRVYIVSVILVALATSALVFHESSTMGIFSALIGIISWVFIFSLWVLLLSEEEV